MAQRMTGPYDPRTMKITCAACGHENREGRKFCAECGAALTPVCPACGVSNEVGEKFCGDCGAALTPVASVGGSAPAPVAGPSEKKHITVLFADVAGSMDLQEQLDAEVWAEIMGRFVALLAEGVRKYGGTVDKFTGDGIMALFGAPVAQEDHARRACHAAWHLTKTIETYSEELRRKQGVRLDVRLGLNSGEVVVGRVGEDMTLDPTALGHTVGLAQRMEALAEPGKAYLTAQTARLVDGWFRLEDVGPLPVKGSREPVQVWRLAEPSLSPARRTVGSAQLVGRQREFAVLEDALALAEEGHAQVVGVVGEAGVGKSRLCEEFARSVAARGITVRRATGVSHGRDVPLLPVLAFIRDNFGIKDGDDPATARRKVTERVLGLDPGLEDTLPLLFDFLEVPDPDRPVLQMAPQIRMRRLFDSVRRFTARRSEREMLVLIVEDLHWFDPQSQAFLERLIESYAGSRTLVVTNFRPEFTAAWMGHSYYRQLPLVPLREDGVAELLGGLLGADLSLAPLVHFVLERTGGNPFFVEEVVRTLVEDATLTGGPGHYRLARALHEIAVPPSISAVLAARIDRLAPEVKTALQTAAVIGREFRRDLLTEVMSVDAEVLDESLTTLCRAELLHDIGDERYRFWHPLTQEVAYGTLLATQRDPLHAAVARAMVKLYPDRLDEQAALVAIHFERAHEVVESARWHFRAAGWALRTDFAEACHRWRQTLVLLRGAEETPDALQLRVQTHVRLIQAGARLGMDPDEAEELLAEGRAVAERLGDMRLLAMLVYVSGTQLLMRGDVPAGAARWMEGIRIAESVSDVGLQGTLGIGPVLAHGWTGPLTEAVMWATRGITLLAGDPETGAEMVGYSPLVRLYGVRAMALARMGRFAEARTDCERVLAMGRPRGESENVQFALCALVELASIVGEAGDSLDQARESMRIGEETGNFMSAAFGLDAVGQAYLLAGCPTEAVEAAERSLADARSHQTLLCLEAFLLINLARARLAAGDVGAAGNAADAAVASARQRGTPVFEIPALVLRARVRRATDTSGDETRTDLIRALDLVGETGAAAYEPSIREELGWLDHDENDWRAALQLYDKLGAPAQAERLQAELDRR
jgi:class 3 adenylate cyclase